MSIVTQIACLLMATACTGQAFKSSATKFDKIAFPAISVCFIICGLLARGGL